MEKEKSKKYFCECGKIFDNSQKVNIHKGNCKTHLLLIGKWEERQKINKMVAQKKKILFEERRRKKEKEAEKQWLAEKHYCKKCGILMTFKYKTGTFCSSKCAYGRVHSIETKNKIKKSVEKFNMNHQKEKKDLKKCKICGKSLYSKNKTNFCRECLNNTIEGKQLLSEIAQKNHFLQIKNGTFHYWDSRKKPSFPECFFAKILTNNKIFFKKEFLVKNEKKGSHYFLDFLIEKNSKKIDLEIDGGQHDFLENKIHDKERDKTLKELGYIVYRIKWNEVTTLKGKNEMKIKIQNFLSFYNNL